MGQVDSYVLINHKIGKIWKKKLVELLNQAESIL